MLRRSKEKYGKSFAEMAIASKGYNKFLEAVNCVIDWDSMSKIIKKYRKNSGLGAASYSDLLLFKIILLQTWYNLSDPAVEEHINDRISFIKFLGISLDSATPDHSTICRFRTFLLENKLHDELFKEINDQLIAKQLIVKNGAIVDATVISSARRPRKMIKGEFVEDRKEDKSSDSVDESNNENPQNDTPKDENKIVVTYSDDEGAAWLKKRGRFHYGYKGHNLVNFQGYFLGGHVTGANVSDINQLEEMITESRLDKGTAVLGDKGYMSKKNVELLKDLEMQDGIMRKNLKNKKLTEEEKIRNKEISKVRYRVEQSFGLLKKHFGYDRMRYIGMDKCNFENTIKMMSFNIKKAMYSIAMDYSTRKNNDLIPKLAG